MELNLTLIVILLANVVILVLMPAMGFVGFRTLQRTDWLMVSNARLTDRVTKLEDKGAVREIANESFPHRFPGKK